ncbi:MAG: ATP-binding cassette domain-containing protein [Chloroflexi bacterium CFX4]|nr:ATP-binding cassette domain-containing protein [Chloroflexi bacterium CFX4]MDL1922676.1 ATP-binding cassette domain-containing protein [Chloroflexi bacterium CFX3]
MPEKNTLSVSRNEIDSRDPTLRISPDSGSSFTTLVVQRTINIGSEARQDIAIQAAGIATRHARLLQEGTTYRIFDLTEGGVLVNNQLIDGSTLLRDGDIIRLQDRSGVGATLTFSNPIERALGSESVGRTYPLDVLPCIIGRDPKAQIHLSSLAVSWHHAIITQQGNAHIIADDGSVNGTFVNDKKLTAPHRLRPEDVIRIDQALFVYNGKGLVRMAATQKLEIDAYNLDVTYRTGLFGRVTLNTMRETSIAIQPREFVAIIGGSGSGKSTLLRTLNGAQPASSGKVLINGDDLYQNYEVYQPIIGYVPQTDIVQDALSVYQTLYYGAKMRFPNEPSASREERIRKVLEALELTDFRDRLVGRLSGGQRKRVSIALELMAEPIMLFMDEPSSGLDPGLDKSMMLTLRRLADRGHIVIVVTHTTLNIDLCDHVALMSRGYLAYYGPPKQALKFFDARDYSEIYNKVTLPPETARATSETMVFTPASSRIVAGAKVNPQDAARQWAEKYRQTPEYQKYVVERLQVHGASVKNSALTNQKLRRVRRGSLWQQTRSLTERTIALVRRDVRTIIALMLVLPLVALFLGLISFDTVEGGRGQMLVSRGTPRDYALLMDQVPLQSVAPVEAAESPDAATDAQPEEESSPARRAAPVVSAVGTFVPASEAERILFILALAVALFGVFASAYVIVVEKSLFLRERMVNLRITAYLASKFSVYGVLAVLSCVVALLLFSLGVMLPTQGILMNGFLELLITMALTALAGVSIGLLISALNRQVNAVTYLVLAVLFMQILFPGVLFKMDGALEPISRLTVTRWALEALGGTVDMVQRNAEGRIVVAAQAVNPKTNRPLPNAPLTRQYFPAPPSLSVTYATNGSELAVRWLVLIGFSLVFLTASHFALRRNEPF